MQSMPFVAFVVAVLAVLLSWAGLDLFALIFMGACILCALLGLAFGHPERPWSSRISCLMAIILATAPLSAPALRDARIRALERKRAVETAPLYAALDANAKTLAPLLDAYRQAAGVFPDFNGKEQLPYMTTQNALQQPLPAAGIVPPTDVFHPSGAPLRWTAIRDYGVLLVSVGQDGVAEMPLPGVFLDGTAHPLAPFAAIGQDPRLVTYDPTNGALGLGDVVRFHGTVTYGDLFGDLFAAFDKGERASPWKPTVKDRPSAPDPAPQSSRDALAAEKLLGEGEYLAALALASRGRLTRDPYPAQWKPGDYLVDRVRGIALYNLGAYREAADALIDHLGSSPNDALAHFYAGAALYAGGNRQGATTHIAAASQIDAASPVANPALSRLEELTRGGTPQFPVPAALGWKPAAPSVPPQP